MVDVPEDSEKFLIDVLANDEDADGDTLTVTDVGVPSHGTVSIGSGGVRYTPNPDYSGPDSFTYTISDGHGGEDTATVHVNVTPVNDPPVATDDTGTTAEDTPISFTEADLVGDDVDVDGDTLTVIAVGNAVNGTVVDNGDGTFTFTPAANFHGTASFDYTVSDGQGGEDIGHVTITVTAANDAPVAVDDPATTVEDTPVTISAAALLANDTDVDGDTLTVTGSEQRRQWRGRGQRRRDFHVHSRGELPRRGEL